MRGKVIISISGETFFKKEDNGGYYAFEGIENDRLFIYDSSWVVTDHSDGLFVSQDTCVAADGSDQITTYSFNTHDPAFGEAEVTLPADITEVQAEAFQETAAVSVDVPDTCISIGDYAFRNCPNLTRIRIHENCELGEDVFAGCPSVIYVYGYPGSDADKYCVEHENCIFVSIDGN